MPIWFHSHFSKAVIGSFIGQTSWMESKMAQSKLVRATATSQVFKLSIRAVLCWSSELSVKGSYRGEKKNNACPISISIDITTLERMLEMPVFCFLVFFKQIDVLSWQQSTEAFEQNLHCAGAASWIIDCVIPAPEPCTSKLTKDIVLTLGDMHRMFNLKWHAAVTFSPRPLPGPSCRRVASPRDARNRRRLCPEAAGGACLQRGENVSQTAEYH